MGSHTQNTTWVVNPKLTKTALTKGKDGPAQATALLENGATAQQVLRIPEIPGN